MRIAAAVVLAAMTAAAAPAPDHDAVVRGNVAFALDLYRREAAQRGGNVFFSPYSISTAMAMVDAGARGATATEIETALHLPFGGARLAQAWSALLGDVNRHAAAYDLVTANALWADRGTAFHAAYLSMARNDFGATVETLDFVHAAEAARARINAWVSEATRKKIETLLAPGTVGPESVLVLTNAIYMKAQWNMPFDANNTDKNGRFHAAGGDVTAPMMVQVKPFRFLHDGGVKVIELRYVGDELSMLVILPDANDGLAGIEKTLTPETLARWERQLELRRVSLGLPRFRSEQSLDLGGTLRAMGIRLAFDTRGAADFSAMTAKKNVNISRVIHKARVDVTEKGTEAAAATAVTMRVGAAVVHEAPPEIFHADHPFLFLIRQTESKSILFIGRLSKP